MSPHRHSSPPHLPSATPVSRVGAGAAAPGPSVRRRVRRSRYPVFAAVESAFHTLAEDPNTRPVRTRYGMLPLTVVRSVLNDPGTPRSVCDGIWRTLVGRARGQGGEWLLAAAGCATPRLRSAIWHATRDRGVELDEVCQIALAAFTETVLTLDPLPATRVLDELVRPARNAAQVLAHRVAKERDIHRPMPHSFPPPEPTRHVDFVLAALVHDGVISRSEADLIGRHRIEGVPVRRIAATSGIGRMSLARSLHAAEARVIAALTEDGAHPDSVQKSPRQA